MINDWYKSKTLEEIIDTKNKNMCVWCPDCDGSGIKTISNFLIFTKQISCPRCKGHSIISSKEITKEEYKELPNYEQRIVRTVQNPDYYSILLSQEPLSNEKMIVLNNWLIKKAQEARLESLKNDRGSAYWLSSRREYRAYNSMISKINDLKLKRIYDKIEKRKL
jgi:hypothetical protein